MTETAHTQNGGGRDPRTGRSVHEGPAGTLGDVVERFAPHPVTLLAVWSHPDDESLLAGGLLAEVARRGGRIVNVTATSGEHGTDDPEQFPPDRLADRRQHELSAALDELGVGRKIALGFGDGSCDAVPEQLGSGIVGAIIDRIDPDVIVGFGPDGVTGHPDHRAVGRWTRSAVADRGDRLPLVTTAAAAGWPSYCIDRLHGIDAFWPGFPERASADVVGRLDAHLVERKLAALECHASQMGPVRHALGPDGFRTVVSTESYCAANSAARHRLNPMLAPLAA